jgi:hypothetical protein
MPSGLSHLGDSDGGPENDPTKGLPPDLARALRNPAIIVPQDQVVWETLAKWANAPSNTASAPPREDEE